ncbi:MAG: ABC transporter ATP-binding protein [Candidatus Hadarchaeales archaeon]
MSYSIVTRRLTREYNGFRALDNLSICIKQNESVGLLGPNGAGKTTTLKILCGLIRPTSGKAFVGGLDVTKSYEKAIVKVGAIIETPEFYPFLTPHETLCYLGRLRGMDAGSLKERIAEVLKMVGLSKWAGIRIEKFSRGMKQRLALAQALLHDPPILILDEPSLGLDPRGMMEVRKILKDVGTKKTILFASHILSEVAEVCRKVAIIDHGRLKAFSEIAKLRRRYGSFERAYLKLTEAAI